MDLSDYTTRLRARLKAAGISEAKLARTAGITPEYMSRLFNTSIDPRLSTVQRLEAAFDRLTQLELFPREGTETE